MYSKQKGPARQNRIRKYDKKIREAEEKVEDSKILRSEEAGYSPLFFIFIDPFIYERNWRLELLLILLP